MRLLTENCVRVVLSASAVAFASADLASAQWGATNLRPAGSPNSEGMGGTSAQQAGFAEVAGVKNAALWTGTAASFVNLHPSGNFDSQCSSTDGATQGGWVRTATGEEHASIWSGSAGSWVDLHPVGHGASRISDVDGTKRVGAVLPAGGSHLFAALWTGSSNAFTDLNPASSTDSWAFGCSGSQQVGVVSLGGQRASLWTGTAASWTDLSPAGSSSSLIYATDGAQQVGRTYFSGSPSASLWSGSAGSHVNLAPGGSSMSEAYAVDGGQQVGYVSMPFLSPHAALWSGSAASFVDLHTVLPTNFTSSKATAIWHANGRTYVLGTATEPPINTATILWTSLHMTTYCTAKTNSLGCTPTIAGLGSSSATLTHNFGIRALSVRNNSNGLLLYSAAGRVATPFHGGTMCVASPKVRGLAMNSAGNNPPTADCSGFFYLDMNQYRAGWLGGTPAPFLSVPGTIVTCQYWARDAGFASPNNVQLSNALEFEVGP